MTKCVKVTLTVTLAVALVSLMMLMGCKGSSSDSPAAPATLASITVSPSSAPTVTVGTTEQFTASALMSDNTATSPVITWATSSTAVATISATGLATAVAKGTVTITATSGSVSGTATMTVTTPMYAGTIYGASEGGGHIGVFPVTIDPTNTTTPITVDTSNVARIQLAAGTTSNNKIVFHDVRLDGNKLYYAAFMSRPSNTSVADIGYVDLTQPIAGTNNGINSTIDIDAPAADTIAFALNAMGVGSGLRIEYCASGMNSTYYFPMSMSFPAYLDAVPRSLLDSGAKGGTSNHITTADIKRTYIEQIDADAAGWARINGGGATNGVPNDLGTPPLAFIHGASSPDGTKLYVSTNVVSGLSTTNNLAGVFRSYLLNASDIENGTMDPSKVITKASFTVAPTLASIAYRASFTPDDKYILQSGADRVLILKASDLSLYDDTNNDAVKVGGGKTGIEVHDVIPTPDSRYAILSVRYYADSTQEAAGIKTSGVQLYDINNKKFIGGITPTCGSSAGACHAAAGDTMSRPVCGVVFKSN